jgi:hypothetical protein
VDIIRNISDFKSFKKLYKFAKPRSPLCIELMTDSIDGWLIDIVKYKKKTGEVRDNFSILRKEIDTWVTKYKEAGWSLTKD